MMTATAPQNILTPNSSKNFIPQYLTIRDKIKKYAKDELNLIENDLRVQKILCLWYQRKELYKVSFIFNSIMYSTSLIQNKGLTFIYLARKYENLYLSSYFKIRERLCSFIGLKALINLEEFFEFQVFALHLNDTNFERLCEILEISPDLIITFCYLKKEILELTDINFKELINSSKTILLKYYKYNLEYESLKSSLEKNINKFICNC